MSKITVATFSSEAEAHLAMGRLAVDGIHGTVNRFSRYRSMGGGGFLLKVEAQDVATATKILDSVNSEIDMDEYVDAEDRSYRRCPECKSVNVTTTPLGWKVVLLGVAMLGVPLLFWPRSYTCRKCGIHWEA